MVAKVYSHLTHAAEYLREPQLAGLSVAHHRGREHQVAVSLDVACFLPIHDQFSRSRLPPEGLTA
jgi:hypothetical protein